MNKRELTLIVAEKTELTQKDAKKAVDAVFETMVEAMERNEKVQVIGFGSFETRKRAARQWKDPSTGKVKEVPACISPAFKSGKSLKARINQQIEQK